MFSGLRDRLATTIARRRDHRLVRLGHRVASAFEAAYGNQQMDGELTLLGRLQGASPRVVFDVGANIGTWTIQALTTWPAAHVHLFEVAAETYARQGAAINNAGLGGRVTRNPAGLGETAGPIPMYYFPDSPDLTCDMPRHPGRASVQFEADILTGDHYLATQAIESVDFLKIDVEGAELKVLDGFRRAIADHRVGCVQFEYGAFAIDTRVRLRDFYDRLSEFWIGKVYPSSVEFRDYTWEIENYQFANYLAVSKRRLDLRTLAAGG